MKRVSATDPVESAAEFFRQGNECFEWKDFENAVSFYRKSAEQGLAEAQYALGECYKNGWGVTCDFAEAVKWFRKAAEQGLAEAQCALGECYEKGLSLPCDYTEAVKWYHIPHDQDPEMPPEKWNLGKDYDYGMTRDQAHVCHAEKHETPPTAEKKKKTKMSGKKRK